jgi:histone deacetylase HOS3
MDVMDKLTSDMKKVKITLVTKSMRESRERERLAKEAAAVAEKSASVSPATLTPMMEENKQLVQQQPSSPERDMELGRGQTVVAAAEDSEMQGDGFGGDASTIYIPDHDPPTGQQPSELPVSTGNHIQLPLNGATTPTLPHGPRNGPQLVITPTTEVAQFIPLPATSPIAPSPTWNTPQQGGSAFSSNSGDIFIPYQPEGPARMSTTGHQQQPLQWLPPNTMATPASGMKRADLPVFTATSAIPFAPAQNQLKKVVKQEKVDEGVWEIPETPQK